MQQRPAVAGEQPLGATALAGTLQHGKAAHGQYARQQHAPPRRPPQYHVAGRWRPRPQRGVLAAPRHRLKAPLFND